MKLNDMSVEELELLSYTDLTYMILKENKLAMNTSVIFKTICDLLDYSDEQYVDGIGDFYTSLTIDKRFILLENNEWDLREKHSINLFEDDEDDEDVDFFETEEDVEENLDNDEELDDELDNDLDNDLDDEIDDLTIVDDEELEM